MEFGALNGIDHSNTYAFEHYMGWKGLMFEIDPHVYSDLERNRPGADIVIGAVCPSGESNITVILSVQGGFSGSIKQFEETRLHTKREESIVKCYNLADELRKRDMMRVDYLTMDTEGSEVDLVLDFPWDDFDVRMVQIEQLHEGRYKGQVGKKEKIIQHMISHGYELYNVFVVTIEHCQRVPSLLTCLYCVGCPKVFQMKQGNKSTHRLFHWVLQCSAKYPNVAASWESTVLPVKQGLMECRDKTVSGQ